MISPIAPIRINNIYPNKTNRNKVNPISNVAKIEKQKGESTDSPDKKYPNKTFKF